MEAFLPIFQDPLFQIPRVHGIVLAHRDQDQILRAEARDLQILFHGRVGFTGGIDTERSPSRPGGKSPSINLEFG
jgi:hypothetical protein